MEQTRHPNDQAAYGLAVPVPVQLPQQRMTLAVKGGDVGEVAEVAWAKVIALVASASTTTAKGPVTTTSAVMAMEVAAAAAAMAAVEMAGAAEGWDKVGTVRAAVVAAEAARPGVARASMNRVHGTRLD
jgi:hypothetical protein